MKKYEELKTIKIMNSEENEVLDFVISEYPLTLYINQEKYVTLLSTPVDLELLIYGYLFGEKIIEKIDDVKSIVINNEEYSSYIELNIPFANEHKNKDLLLTSGCGVGTAFHENIDDVMIDMVTSDFKISLEDISKASRELNDQSGLFKMTGGVHSCLLLSKDDLYYFEDIGRHNAVDKIVGKILLDGINTSQSFLFSSGRISSDMLLKCALIKIPIVISRSAPTSLAYKLAEKLGITLVGFARGKKLNIYTNAHRIVR